VTVGWNWQGNNGVYGLQALSQGAGGVNNSDGSGGAGGSATVTLTKGGNVTVGVSGNPPVRGSPTASDPPSRGMRG
jgi:hypothetical protein